MFTGAELRPVATQNSVSPSPMVWHGRMVSARPSCADDATKFACALSSPASVATTPMVVLVIVTSFGRYSPLRMIPTGSAIVPSSRRGPAIRPPSRWSWMPPQAFTATAAPTDMPLGNVQYADPIPPFTTPAGPNPLATVAPVPAPTEPDASGASLAASAAAYPAVASGRTSARPTPRSYRIAAGTMGTQPCGVSKPMPRSSSHRCTPSAAASPNALPPLSRMAWTRSTRRIGSSRSVSRVPGDPPRTATPPTALSPHSTTVQPVAASASVQWPAAMPGTAVMVPAGRECLIGEGPSYGCGFRKRRFSASSCRMRSSAARRASRSAWRASLSRRRAARSLWSASSVSS